MDAVLAGGGDQDVEAYATDALGRIVAPTTATAGIVDLCEPESADASVRIVAATAPATVDPTSTTTTAAAGPREEDHRKIPAVSAAGFVVGRKYAIEGGGHTEAFELERVDGLDLYARDHLRNRFETGATVRGVRVSATFPAARADDSEELDRRAIFGVDWTFVGVTGEPLVRTLVRIERRGRAPRATASDLILLDPNLETAMQGRATLSSHLRRADLELDALSMRLGHHLADEDEGGIGTIAVTYRALELAYRVLGPDFDDRATWAGREAKKWIKMVLDGYRPDDAVETTRSEDQARPRRRRMALGTI